MAEQSFSLAIGQLVEFGLDLRFDFFGRRALHEYRGEKRVTIQGHIVVQRQFTHLLEQLE